MSLYDVFMLKRSFKWQKCLVQKGVKNGTLKDFDVVFTQKCTQPVNTIREIWQTFDKAY